MTNYCSQDHALLESYSQVHNRSEIPFLRSVFSDQESTQSFMDIGCGNGSLVEDLRELYPLARIDGVDIDASNLPDQPGFTAMDIRDFIASDLQYDIIHSRFLMSHIPDRNQLLEQLWNKIPVGGYIIITDFYLLNPADSPDPVIADFLQGTQDKMHERGIDGAWIRTVPALLGSWNATLDVDIYASTLLDPGYKQAGHQHDHTESDGALEQLPHAALERLDDPANFDIPRINFIVKAQKQV